MLSFLTSLLPASGALLTGVLLLYAIYARWVDAPTKLVLDHRLLAGITRKLVLELAVRHAMPVALRDIPDAELRAADELWLTSSTREVLPITTLDCRPVGSGQPGPAWRRMSAWYARYRDQATGCADG